MIHKFLKRIESFDYMIKVMGVSSLEDLRERARRHSDADALIESAKSNAQWTRLLERRIKRIAKKPSDLQYRHSGDIALFTYLDLLEELDHEAALESAKLILEVPNSWWSARLATRLTAMAKAMQDMWLRTGGYSVSNDDAERAGIVATSGYAEFQSIKLYNSVPLVAGTAVA